MKSPVSLSSSLILLLLLLLCNCFSEFQSHAQRIPENEVQTLRVISQKLNIEYWKDVSQTSCDNGSNWFNITSGERLSSIGCNCSYNNNTTCHVTSIVLKSLSLPGIIPDEFANLTELKEIDLTRNYISGPIPTSLTKIPLVKLNLGANRINGSIPKEIGQIPTLQELVLDGNLVGGQLPPSLGNLKGLKRLLLSGNKVTGKIPETFGNLRNLTDFRIDGNSLSGSIPGFIWNWTMIEKLHMQGTNMKGTIPSSIASLTKLKELLISDLGGPSMMFPNVSTLSNLQYLVLRNCSITGRIPDYFENMKMLKILDLSFNSLSGPIPPYLQNLISQKKFRDMFLTNNLLDGSIEEWITSSSHNIDISYNNFSGSVTSTSICTTPQLHLNLASSFPSRNANSDRWCWEKDLPCPKKAKHHSFFINCGGTEIYYDGKKYEGDSPNEGASYFSSTDNWAISNTGVFIGNEDNGEYIASISGHNETVPPYYKTARLSPLSLKYYGICMRKGSYTVKLHFAEIIISNDRTYSSNGRRIFDVAIQGNVMLVDFNIMEEAGRAGKGITKEFKDVLVNGSTLEIHLYWRGKGTNNVPKRGDYGPLISAITVTPNFKTGLPVGALVGIVVASLAVAVLILVLTKRMGFLGRKEPKEFQGLDTGYFSLRQIKAATNDFNPANKIGEGGFGPVYKGVLSDGKVIAVKQLSSKSKQGNREFVNEIGTISALQHPNLVKLYGCCTEGQELLLIYEYMENNSLARALFGNEEQRLNLDWPTRKKICLGIARGLAYLHEESRLKIVHRDIKATNVLLDKDLNAKISDFGLAKLDDDENTHISTRVAGTIGYMAPEYAMRGYLTYKADVYSFGVVVLETVSGKSNTSYRPREEFVYLLDWAYVLHEQGKLLDLVDLSLGSDYSEEEALKLLNLALLCTNPSPSLRPVMSSVVSMIEATNPVQAQVDKLSETKIRAIQNLPRDNHSQVSTISNYSYAQVSTDSQYSAHVQRSNISTDESWIDSSVTIKSKDESEGSSPSTTLLER